jgi:hypothetical protein
MRAQADRLRVCKEAERDTRSTRLSTAVLTTLLLDRSRWVNEDVWLRLSASQSCFTWLPFMKTCRRMREDKRRVEDLSANASQSAATEPPSNPDFDKSKRVKFSACPSCLANEATASPDKQEARESEVRR